ncbi:macro domain-containing protein [Streptomyces sp. NPDC004082]|uniref:macro domain-containing protein n=1 Tax=unclassified Streptomyces TaxID=2593676 RepID=UPI0033A6D9D3
MIGYSLRVLLHTPQGLRLLARECAVQFGLVSGATQLYLAFWPDSSLPRWPALLGIVVLATIGGVLRSWPRSTVSREFTGPGFTVTVQVGDLFDRESHLVVGFNDVFDTDTSDERLIVRRSVQGQFLHRVYAGDLARLDGDLATALREVGPVGLEERSAKRAGKLVRYPVGTVAVLDGQGRRFFCAAYGRMGADLVISSGADQLWHTLWRLWTAVHLHGQREAVAMPVIGAGLARIDSMDHKALLKLILLSFVTRSRESVVCKSLTVVVHPGDYDKVDMLELGMFLRSL